MKYTTLFNQVNKISIVVDTKKLDKTRIKERTFKNREGVEVVSKELKLDIIPLKEKRVVASGQGWKLLKVAFVAETPTKEESQAMTKTNIVGDGLQFEKDETPNFDRDSQGNEIKGQNITEDDIPFD
jgi:hypothetical protein